MDFVLARRTMVESQIRTNRVTDPLVIQAMSEVPREAFLPPSLRGIAYVDEDVALGGGRFLMKPLIVAHLLQAAEVRATSVVMEIGCATGYACALASRIASAVIGVESDSRLLTSATATLAELGYSSATIVDGALGEGFPRQGPYDVIIFGGAVADVPQQIVAQLANGGRIVAVIRGRDGVGRLTLLTRTEQTISRRAIMEATAAHLPGFVPEPDFQL